VTLSTEQVEHYRTHGWIAPIDIMSPEEAAANLAALESAEAAYPSDLNPEHRNNAHLAFPFLADLAIDPRIVDCASALVGPDISLWSTVLFIKEPDSSAFVSWHQDAFYMGLETSNFVTAWLALSPSTVDSGCVSVIPESHRRLADHTDTFGADNILTRGQEVAEIDPSTAVHLELQPGQMSLHHPWLIHGSQPNRSSRRRVGLALQSYLGGDVTPLRGEHHVLPVRGAPPAASFHEVARPDSPCSARARDTRSRANRALASVLYDGSAELRKL